MASTTGNPLVPTLTSDPARALAALYDRIGDALLRVARVMLGATDQAEDAVQDVFVELVRRRDRLQHVQDLDAYLFAMLRNNIAGRLHRLRNERARLSAIAPVMVSQPAERSSEDLDIALAALPPEQREVIALKVDGGLTFAQIGAVLDISANTAASRYRYALEKLRKILE